MSHKVSLIKSPLPCSCLLLTERILCWAFKTSWWVCVEEHKTSLEFHFWIALQLYGKFWTGVLNGRRWYQDHCSPVIDSGNRCLESVVMYFICPKSNMIKSCFYVLGIIIPVRIWHDHVSLLTCNLNLNAFVWCRPHKYSVHEPLTF